MIQPEDIRIGNHLFHLGVDYEADKKVLDDAKDEFITVTKENIEKIKECHNDYAGIPLTADLLKRAGFVKDEAQEYEPHAIHYYLKLNLDGLQHKYLHALVYEDLSVTVNCVIDEVWDQCNISLLHLLQNAYFDLTSEELTINLGAK